MKIKICGMKYPSNILEIAALQPDFLGFIFWKKSARFFDGIIPNLPKSIRKVGVFVNEELLEIKLKVIQYQLDLVQLHGEENASFCKELQANNIKVIKAFAIDAAFDFDKLEEYDTACEYFLFDTKGKLPGGNGTTFDWNLLKKYQLNKPFFLSGGIGLQEINDIKQFINSEVSKYCIAIDVNSKFEIEPGLKNEKELENLKKLLHEN